ncbi:hypothetical protein CSC2_44800 [Clostridium zeae]|uniref:Cohesin domain-containing protein n=1 Tax=Clostridium zeae TaxID=2759022 RepID=A0ABQ1EGY8_9CLOT|nr:hypothetical protein [Clostridium zeae]GFZ33954.1 hypothetical protein CSC2_44800 [Clostridium zeae]
MKFKIVIVALLFMIMLNTTVYAAGTQVDVNINGNVKSGNSVDIIFNVKDVSRLYAGSIEFTYDTSVMKVESINGGEFIKTNNPKIMEFGGDTAKNGNIADYYFTCVGKVEGFTGSGSFVVIKANVLNQDKFNIYKKNLKIQLVERNTNNEMKDITYTISGDVKDEAPPNNSGSAEPSNSSGKDAVNENGTGTGKSDESDKGQNSSGSGSASNNSGSKANNSSDSKEDKGFIATVIDNIKSIFSGSSSKEADKKQIDNSSADNNKSNTSSTNNSNDKNSAENKANTATDSTKSNQDTVDQGSKNVSSNASSKSNNFGIVVGVVILVVLLVASGGLIIKKRNNKK